MTKVLDHGHVVLRNLAGPTRRPLQPFDAQDSDPAQAARMSFDQMNEDRTEDQDRKLCDYLMKNWHTSPFEMIEAWFDMKMPIFVARQFVRHRTASLNEVSGRYITLPAEWYIPEVVGGKAPSAKQGQDDNLRPATQHWFRTQLDNQCQMGYDTYQEAIAQGVAPEHARMLLHLNHYTHWLWKQDLHNLLHLLSLRDHFHAQVEARAYAEAIDLHLRTHLPGTMELYDKYRRQNARVLRSEMLVLLDALKAANGMIENAIQSLRREAFGAMNTDAIQSLNETPGIVARAIAMGEKL